MLIFDRVLKIKFCIDLSLFCMLDSLEYCWFKFGIFVYLFTMVVKVYIIIRF